MRSHILPLAGIEVSSLVLGQMRISQLDDRAIRALFDRARSVGINTFDHADIYGGTPHMSEERFGSALRLTATDRERIVLQSKAGIRKGYFDFSAAHIERSVDESLVALKSDYLDIFLLHRPDTLVEPEEVAAAFQRLHQSGKVRHFGVSNHTPRQIDLLRTAVSVPLVVNQVQLSLAHAPVISSGLAANMQELDQSIDRDGELLAYSRIARMGLQAWSPFQHGFFGGSFVGDRANYAQLNDALDELATAYGTTPTGIAVAWITRHPANIQVVLGTTNPDRVAESAEGSEIILSREEWYRLFTAAGYTLP